MDRTNTPAARPGNAPVTRLGGASGGGAGTPVAGHDRHPTRGGGWQLPPSPPTPHPPSRDASLQSPRKNGRPARTARRPRPPPTVRPWRYGQLHVATAPWQWGAPPRRRLVGHRGCHAPPVGRRSRRRHTAAAPPSGGDAGHASDCQTAVAPVAWSPTRPLTSARGGARLAAHALEQSQQCRLSYKYGTRVPTCLTWHHMRKLAPPTTSRMQNFRKRARNDLQRRDKSSRITQR